MAIPRKWLNWSIDQRINADLHKAGIKVPEPADFVGFAFMPGIGKQAKLTDGKVMFFDELDHD
jgi:hypothetical protein